MGFFLRGSWHVYFLEKDLRTPLRRKLNFGDPDKIRELIQRTPTKQLSEDKQAVEHAITHGRGGVWLELTAEQYALLCR